MRVLILFVASLLFWSCRQHPKKLSAADYEKYLKLGDSLTSETQKILLKNVSEQIAQNGVVQAVHFCNENAISLTKKLEKEGIAISRLSDKNRNPKNEIQSQTDKQAWEKMTNLLTENQPKHFILEADGAVFYYKAIPLAMPTCLACHGNKQTDIQPEVQQIITQKYPNDKATNYKMGELRGLWKMKID
ncbi:DUF3365 domain-containing protein [Capnocytophaga sp.]|uniref:c-type heme family protein n=1 Tax=Capnocytophaga sp. TaxID=44737 RepID=UPI0026DA7D6B|nr:DUF3365 domain-containing protein [Capnocytophaga sp.]MDO5104431.1 DUF3365 domain-containing protein [Capnocytophaga sp.]